MIHECLFIIMNKVNCQSNKRNNNKAHRIKGNLKNVKRSLSGGKAVM